MYNLAKIIQVLFPLLGLLSLFIGIKKKQVNYVISALWLSLIALITHFQLTGNQIFGTYFGYLNASLYSFAMLVLLLSLIRLSMHLSSPTFKYVAGFINSFLVVGSSLVIANLWINAFFIENKKMNTPIIQIAHPEKPDYCQYKYIIYKVAADDTIGYLCPNHYGLIPATGKLTTSPDFIANQFHLPTKNSDTKQGKNKNLNH